MQHIQSILNFFREIRKCVVINTRTYSSLSSIRIFFLCLLDRISSRLRQRRIRHFISVIQPLSKPLTVLDLGGTNRYWNTVGITDNKLLQLTLVNIKKEQNKNPARKTIKQDVRDLSRCKDKQYDVVFSNSLIEHLASKRAQKKLANDIQRIGKYYYIQTPNAFFFFDPHYALPLFFLVPSFLKPFYILLFSIKWKRKKGFSNLQEIRKHMRSIRLLSEKEIKELFPDGVIVKEKILGLTKSLTVHNIYQ